MIFAEAELAGVFVIDVERREDERGFFARAWCERELAEHDLSTRVVQCNIAYNNERWTVRGMHFQEAPHAEVKLVRCTRGAVFDVVIDLRAESATFGQWLGVELTAENRRMVYVPAGCAHGYQTLADDTETYYQMSEFHDPSSERGVRWDDPAFGIVWPNARASSISERDRSWPDYEPHRS